MKKQFLSLGVAAAVSASLLAGCGSSASNTAASTAGSAASEAASTASTETAAAASTSAAAEETASAEAVDPSSMKIGMICVGDEAVTYDKAHIDGITAAAGKVGIGTDQIVFKKNVPEDATAYDAAVELVESQGCNLVISDSYGHQNFMVQAAEEYAEEYPDVQFVSMTGDFAALSGLDNFHNAFDNIYEARYVSGVVAGMKVQQLVDDGKLTDDNYDKDGKVKIGYVGAFNYAEVVSGYTAFYLGLTSVYPDAHMYVDYTNSWFDVDAEAATAEKLIADGCVIIGQHADSTGAPSAVEQAFQDGNDHVFSVGYNISMLDVAPDVALTSASNGWERLYEYVLKNWLDGSDIVTDWTAGYEDKAVMITELGKACAPGTAEAVAEAEGKIVSGELHVFDASTFTIGGETPTSILGDVDADFTPETECLIDGYFHESEFRSAPYFAARIDGITELN